MDSKIFGVINVRAAVLRNEAPERQVGNVLHRGERQERLVPRQQSIECGDRIHENGPSGEMRWKSNGDGQPQRPKESALTPKYSAAITLLAFGHFNYGRG